MPPWEADQASLRKASTALLLFEVEQLREEVEAKLHNQENGGCPVASARERLQKLTKMASQIREKSADYRSYETSVQQSPKPVRREVRVQTPTSFSQGDRARASYVYSSTPRSSFYREVRITTRLDDGNPHQDIPSQTSSVQQSPLAQFLNRCDHAGRERQAEATGRDGQRSANYVHTTRPSGSPSPGFRNLQPSPPQTGRGVISSAQRPAPSMQTDEGAWQRPATPTPAHTPAPTQRQSQLTPVPTQRQAPPTPVPTGSTSGSGHPVPAPSFEGHKPQPSPTPSSRGPLNSAHQPCTPTSEGFRNIQPIPMPSGRSSVPLAPTAMPSLEAAGAGQRMHAVSQPMLSAASWDHKVSLPGSRSSGCIVEAPRNGDGANYGMSSVVNLGISAGAGSSTCTGDTPRSSDITSYMMSSVMPAGFKQSALQPPTDRLSLAASPQRSFHQRYPSINTRATVHYKAVPIGEAREIHQHFRSLAPQEPPRASPGVGSQPAGGGAASAQQQQQQQPTG